MLNDNQDKVLERVIGVLDELDDVELVRNMYDEVKVDTYNGKDVFQLRFSGDIFDLSIGKGEEVL